MKKQYNLDNLADSLSSSVFFQENKTDGRNDQIIESRPSTPIQAPPLQPDHIAVSPDRHLVVSSDRRATSKRLIVRRGFDYYEDQLKDLKRISLQEQLDGRDGSMSRMLREALDEYLQKRLQNTNK
jgi:hypothetical protein